LLHTVNKSPFDRTAFTSCLAAAQADDHILLFEDGVIAAMAGTKFEPAVKEALANRKIYALGPDLQARGIDRIVDGVEICDYAKFVSLAVDHVMYAWL